MLQFLLKSKGSLLGCRSHRVKVYLHKVEPFSTVNVEKVQIKIIFMRQ